MTEEMILRALSAAQVDDTTWAMGNIRKAIERGHMADTPEALQVVMARAAVVAKENLVTPDMPVDGLDINLAIGLLRQEAS